mmetsp:Transcript_6706/g.15759  ORF Transcript_6706/g.15759 Transcript_6706/m.15759 type:complete len:343 (+) Transcript_6706:133-1161(+)
MGTALLFLSLLALALGLVLAAVTLRGRSDGARSELLSRMEIAQRGLMAAQGRVQRDLAKLEGRPADSARRYSALGGLQMENPETEWTRTPRVAHKARFAPNKRYCQGGNCESFDSAGVVSDRWPIDMYSAIPTPIWDPAADPQRARQINQRSGPFEGSMRADTYHPPVEWGIGGLENQGNMAAEDRGEVALNRQGVATDKLPVDVYSAFPNPGWDRTEFDMATHRAKTMKSDPLDVVEEARQSNDALESAGVSVNGAPTDVGEHSYNQVDGFLDTLVKTEATPKFRQGGVAAQERPTHFLLRDEPNLMDRQAVEDRDLGYEKPGAPARPWRLGAAPAGGRTP